MYLYDINKNFKHSKTLVLADDVKRLRNIDCPRDQSKLQVDLDTIIKWAKINDLELNTDEHSSLTFRIGDYFKTSYLMKDVEVERVNKQRDLGITFQENFEVHCK